MKKIITLLTVGLSACVLQSSLSARTITATDKEALRNNESLFIDQRQTIIVPTAPSEVGESLQDLAKRIHALEGRTAGRTNQTTSSGSHVYSSARGVQGEINAIKRELYFLRQRQSQQGCINLALLDLEKRIFQLSVRTGMDPDPYKMNGLLVNFSTINEDLVLLQHHQKDVQIDRLLGINPAYPQVEFSGKVEGQVAGGQTWNHTGFSTIDLDNTTLDFWVRGGAWAEGYVSLVFDSSPDASGLRITNSRVYLRRGFVTIGNLAVTPIYGTIGQMYVPFGSYQAGMVTSPMVQRLGRTNARAVLGGFQLGSPNEQALNGQIYAFNGESFTTNTNTVINSWGGSLNYKTSFGKNQLVAGTGYISNLSDSDAMQFNGLTATGTFGGFGSPIPPSVINVEQLQHFVAGFDIYGSWSYDPFTIYSEYVTATQAFALNDLSYNGNGAQPSAFHIEGDYSWNVCEKPFVFFLNYDQSWQALALNLPYQSYTAALLATLLPNTLESLEFRHDVNYASGTTANGGQAPASGTPIVPQGGSRNTVTFQIGLAW